jgi:hypothetical protein
VADSSIVIRVDSTRGGSTVSYTSKGRYVSFQTAGYQAHLPKQAIQPTTSLKAYWTSVLDIVLADIAANG